MDESLCRESFEKTYIWLNAGFEAKCYEVDVDTLGQNHRSSYFVTDEKCKPFKKAFKWIDMGFGPKCYEIDAQTSGKIHRSDEPVDVSLCGVGKENSDEVISIDSPSPKLDQKITPIDKTDSWWTQQISNPIKYFLRGNKKK